MSRKIRVLFICTAKAVCSQMAEGLMRAKYGDRFDVFSAGTHQSRVSTRAIRVMREIGIDMSHYRSKTLNEMSGMTFDLAVTLCNRANQICPVVSCAKKTIHNGFPDPRITFGNEEDLIKGYRSMRDGIALWIEKTFGTPAH
jgi:arsenate reductase